MKFVIPGRPVSLQRPRFSSGHVYDSQKKIKQQYAFLLAMQYAKEPITDRGLEMIITFYFKLPVRRKQAGYHTCRPDLSNLIKFIEDVAIGVLYKDDDCIARIVAEKRYDKEDKTEIQINLLV